MSKNFPARTRKEQAPLEIVLGQVRVNIDPAILEEFSGQVMRFYVFSNVILYIYPPVFSSLL